MRKLFLFVPVAVIATACATLGGSEGFATRVLAGLNCVAAITAAGGQVAADPDLGFSTATDAFNAINKVASGPGLQAAMAACADTFKYLAEDMTGAKTLLSEKAASTENVAQRKARMARVTAKAQATPVVVKVPIR